jgi:exopolysaccharide biosynthesis polyprenyl glycosylphosphotransferase
MLGPEMLARQRKARVLFGLSDVILSALAFEAAYQTRSWLESVLQLEHTFFIVVPVKALVLGFTLFTWVTIAVWLELYDRLDTGHPRIILRDTFRQCLYGAAALVLFEYSFRLDLSRFFLSLFFAYSFVFLLTFRLTAGRMVGVIRREFAVPHYVVLVGTGDRAVRLAEMLESSEQYGVRLHGFLDESGPGGREIQLRSTYPVHAIGELPGLLRQHVIDEIIFAVPSDRLAELEEQFLLCDEEGIRTRVAVDFFPHVNSTISLERLASVPMLTFSAAPYDELRLLVKRLTDIVIAAAGLVVLAPLMLGIIALIRATSQGPAIFRQMRCGLNGRRFQFYKFRSMVLNAEELKASLSHLSTKQTAFKIPDDPRMTKLGRWLRKFSIDEWPQLWNVLRGDMSLVGPRPAVPSEVANYQRWQRRRLRMRPGLTCLWAVSGRDTLDFDTWMKLDMQYIDNWSLALDWKIMLRTIPHVLTGRGAN